MEGKLLEQLTEALGSNLADGDLIYLRRPTADKTIRDMKITWGELKTALGISVGTITSVFGRTTSAITAAASDYDASQIDNDSAVAGSFVSDALNNLNTTDATKANKTQTIVIAGNIDSPGNTDHNILIKSPVGFTITEVTTKAKAGSITATWKIDGVALGGSANAVSTAEESQVHASNNVVAVGQDLTCTTSADSGCTAFSFTITATQTLAV